MSLREIFRITRQTRILLIVLALISLTGFTVAYFYYGERRRAEDPRVMPARTKLAEYDRLISRREYAAALQLLDTVYRMYQRTPGYRGSYEFGVIFNNRGSAYLSMALYDSALTVEEKNQLFTLAEEQIMQGIKCYEKWIDSAGAMSREQIRVRITPFFDAHDSRLKGMNITRIIRKRTDDIVNAQVETPRRLSVSYTNLGVLQRHQYRQEEAVQSYIEAIKLWKDNFTARNNLNVLMGKPPEDRSFIDKLFPPKRL